MEKWEFEELDHREDCYVRELSNEGTYVSQKHCSCGRFTVLAFLQSAKAYITLLETCDDEDMIKESYEAKRYKHLLENKTGTWF